MRRREEKRSAVYGGIVWERFLSKGFYGCVGNFACLIWYSLFMQGRRCFSGKELLFIVFSDVYNNGF